MLRLYNVASQIEEEAQMNAFEDIAQGRINEPEIQNIRVEMKKIL